MKLDFVSFLKKQSNERYKTFIVYSKPLLGKTTFAKEYASKLKGKYINFLELISKKTEIKKEIDTFFPKDFKRFLKKFERFETNYIFVDNIDFILNLWTNRDLEEFLNIIERYQSKKTIIIFMQDRKFLHKREISNNYGESRIINAYDFKQF